MNRAPDEIDFNSKSLNFKMDAREFGQQTASMRSWYQKRSFSKSFRDYFVSFQLLHQSKHTASQKFVLFSKLFWSNLFRVWKCDITKCVSDTSNKNSRATRTKQQKAKVFKQKQSDSLLLHFDFREASIAVNLIQNNLSILSCNLIYWPRIAKES